MFGSIFSVVNPFLTRKKNEAKDIERKMIIIYEIC